MESVDALIHKKDDRVRKEFEKWAILTYSDNRAVINEKKGADKGIDGVAYTRKSATEVSPGCFRSNPATSTRQSFEICTELWKEETRLAEF